MAARTGSSTGLALGVAVPAGLVVAIGATVVGFLGSSSLHFLVWVPLVLLLVSVGMMFSAGTRMWGAGLLMGVMIGTIAGAVPVAASSAWDGFVNWCTGGAA